MTRSSSSSDDQPLDHAADVKLLPLKAQGSSKSDRSPQNTPSTSDGEPYDIGQRIEQVLRNDRSALSESFNLDLEDGDSLRALSEADDEDYGALLQKDQQDTYAIEEQRGWRSKIPAALRGRPLWQVGLLLVAGVLLMVFAANGIRWRFLSDQPGEFDSVPWYPTPLGGTSKEWEESYGKAHDMVGRMTLLEKVNVTTGTGWMMGLCLVGFPSLCLQDGPLGLRFADNITAFPAGITTGATWNRQLMRARGSALGEEARLKGVNVLLGPSMGALGLMPAGGRNWESFGSDPVLQAVAAAETIQGIQSHGVIATAKHFVMNEQEHFRQPNEWGIPTALSSDIDDRALHEVFVWPFAESVRAGVASIMCAYQMVNGSHSCENSKLLNGILKDELGFQGFVQSDWLAQRSGVQSALSGLDMSMPGDGLNWADGKELWGSHLTRAVLNTSVPAERLNDMDSWAKPSPEGEGGPNFSSWTNDRIGGLHPGSPDDRTEEVVNHYVNPQGVGPGSHGEIARQVAAEGTVLLKNVNETLPLMRSVTKAAGKYRVGLYGEDAGSGKGPNSCADRGCNQGTLASGWGSGAVQFPYLVSPSEALKTAWSAENTEVNAYLTNQVTDEDLAEQDLCIVFANADGGEGYIHSEGIKGDRNDLFLQHNGAQLIEQTAQNCGGGSGRTVVVIHSIGPVVLESWIDLPGVHAVVYANLPGQESGNALVDVLFGDVDASGRLPYTIGRKLEDYGPGAQIRYEPDDPFPRTNLSQGLYIDYRYFDKFNIEPRFEFGFGLSYTSFNMSSLRIEALQNKTHSPAPRPTDSVKAPHYEAAAIDPSSALFPPNFNILGKYIYPYLTTLSGTAPAPYPYPDGYNKKQAPSPAGGGLGGNPALYEPLLQLSVDVTNTGSRSGKEVVQIYHRGLGWAKETIQFPDRVLRNFEKVYLEPGDTVTVNMTLTRKDLSYWSVRAQNWLLPEGKFRIHAGRSSRDLPLLAEF
ncbi:hypothetical protein N7470_007518 [Penicillium chermesinum]|nr:hypothetical protein N7470_007518 [Penicillium chermesinum]